MYTYTTARSVQRLTLLCTLIYSAVLLQARAEKESYLFTDSYIETEISQMHGSVQIAYERSMRDVVTMYATSPETVKLLDRSELYFPIFEELLAHYGLPDDLKYLSVIESGLRPKARSKAGAVGLWQFMKGTGQMMGLKIHSSVDERMDPYASTEAAVLYLSDLYSQYDDWVLALCAYNCGPGNVNKAIRRAGSRDFAQLRRYLPSETRRYIPKFVAASYFLQHHSMYDVYPSDERTLYGLAVVQLFHKTTLSEIADACGISKYDIAMLNPAYRRGYIPASKRGYNITLPAEVADQYMYAVMDLGIAAADAKIRSNYYAPRSTQKTKSDYKIIMVDEIVTHEYEVSRGDNLYNVAREYGINLYELKRQNNLSSSLIKPGQRLVISKTEKVRKYIPIVHIPEPLATASTASLPELSALGLQHRISIIQREYVSSLPAAEVASADDMKDRRRAFLSVQYAR